MISNCCMPTACCHPCPLKVAASSTSQLMDGQLGFNTTLCQYYVADSCGQNVPLLLVGPIFMSVSSSNGGKQVHNLPTGWEPVKPIATPVPGSAYVAQAVTDGIAVVNITIPVIRG